MTDFDALTPAQLMRQRARVRPTANQRVGEDYKALAATYRSIAVKRGARPDIEIAFVANMNRLFGTSYKVENGGQRIVLDASILPVSPTELDLSDAAHATAFSRLHGLLLFAIAQATMPPTPQLGNWGAQDVVESLVGPARALRHALANDEDTPYVRAAAAAVVGDLRTALSAQLGMGMSPIAVVLLMEAFGLVDPALAHPGGLEAVGLDDVQAAQARAAMDILTTAHDAASAQAAVDTLCIATGMDAHDLSWSAISAIRSDEQAATRSREWIEAATHALAQASEDELENLREMLGVAYEDAAVGIVQIIGIMTEEKQIAQESEAYGGDGGYGNPSDFSDIEGFLRMPTQAEQAQRERLAIELRKARERGSEQVRTSQLLPAQRLHGPSALRAAAERAMGRVVQAKPWRKIHSEANPEPKLTVAMMLDTSGSMGNQIEPCSAASWIIASATHDAGGAFVATTFGDAPAVHIAKDGLCPKYVTDFRAGGGTGYADECLKLASEHLDLDNEKAGPRMVVLVSDGLFVDRTRRMFEELREKGVLTVQVGFGATPPSHGADEIITATNPEDMVNQLGAIAARELDQFGR